MEAGDVWKQFQQVCKHRSENRFVVQHTVLCRQNINLSLKSHMVLAPSDAHLQQASNILNELDVHILINIWCTPEVSKPCIEIQLIRVSRNAVINM